MENLSAAVGLLRLLETHRVAHQAAALREKETSMKTQVNRLVYPALLLALAGAATASLNDQVSPQGPSTPSSSAATAAKDAAQASIDVRPPRLTAAEMEMTERLNPAKAKGKLVLAQLAAVCSSTPAVEGAAANYYMYRGMKVTMPLQPRLAVQFAASMDNAEQVALLQQLGVAAEGAGGIGKDLVLVDVTGGFAGTADVAAVIAKLSSSQLIAWASPVFSAPLEKDAWWVPTMELTMMLKPEALAAGHTVASVAAEYASESKVTAAVGDTGAMLVSVAGKSGFATMTLANALAADARVAFAEPAERQRLFTHLTPNDPRYVDQWHLNNTASQTDDIDAPQAWDRQTGFASVRIAILDEGTQQNHPDINQVAGRDFTTGAVGGIADGGPTSNCEPHGTPVAGLVTATFNNNLGVAGVAPLCDSLACKVADRAYAPNPCMQSFTAFSNVWATNAIAHGEANSCRVANMSYSTGGVSAAFEAQVSNSYSNGLISVASAGNNSVNSLSYPSSAPFVVSVAALTNTGSRAGFSSWGPGLDISAPGVGLLATDRTGTAGYNTSAGAAGDYTSFSGTSAAAPVTAGVFALFFSNNRSASSLNARFALLFSARDLGVAGYDTDFGYGFVNAYEALLHYAPSNDMCSAARDITSYAYTNTMSTQFATTAPRQPEESCGSATNLKDVFYDFTTSDYGTATIDTEGSDYDTVLSAFNGCGNSIFSPFGGIIYIAPTALGCDDDGGTGLLSQLSGFAIVPGRSYKFKVGQFGSTARSGGNLTFNFNFVPSAPPNDSCGSATVIPGSTTIYNPVDYNTAFATVPATICGDPPNTCTANPGGYSVWYTYTPDQSGFITVDTEGSNYDTVLSIYRPTFLFGGCNFSINGNCVQPTSVACNDDGGTGLLSLLTDVPVTAGSSYLIKVAAYNTIVGGLLDFNFSFRPAACSIGDLVGGDGNPPADGSLDGNDFTAFLNAFAASNALADIVGGNGNPPADGSVDGNDFTAFLNAFGAGC